MELARNTVYASDGAELVVWTLGPSAGEPVILVHGFSLDHTTFVPIAKRLADAGYRVVATDLRGHGQSTLGAAPPNVDRLVADLAETVSALELPAAHLVGHSLGAVVVLSARTNDLLSGSIKSVTSIAGTEQSIQNPIMKVGARLFSSRAGIWLLRRKRAGRLMISTWFGKNPSDDDLDWIRELSAACERTTRVAISDATADLDLRPTFRLAGAPSMVVCGRRDKATPPKVSDRIAEAIDDAELHLVVDAGHMVIIEKPDVVVDLLSDWFSRQS